MNIPSTLLLAAVVALAAPGASLAAGKKYVVKNVQSEVYVALHGDGIDADGYIPVDRNRIEFHEGAYDPFRDRREFMLTRLHLSLRGFYIPNTSEGRISFDNVALELRGALRWWAGRTGFQTGTLGDWEILIPPDKIYQNGDATFLAGGFVTQNKRWLVHDMDRPTEPIVGHINLDSGTFELRTSIEARVAAPWWAFWADDFTRKFVITVKGEFPSILDEGFERGPDEGRKKPAPVPVPPAAF